MSTTQTSEHFDFLLVRQKDFILDLVNRKRTVEATACLAVLKELWYEHSYGYKYEELTERIKQQRTLR
jgi:hypothetical protein